MLHRSTTFTVAAALALTACGGGGGPDLPPGAEEGRGVFRSNGCASCHGSNGQGGAGPSFEGLYESEVALEDGSTVIADADYLRESIVDPRAKVVEGYRLPMPEKDLSDEEIDQVITFIAALGDTGTTS